MSQPQTESQRNRRTAKRILAIFLPFVIVAGVGVGYAYWTTTGTGTGSASTAPSADTVTITQTAGPTTMAPGIAAGAVAVDVTNNGSSDVHVAKVTVSIAGVTKASGVAGSCGTGDYVLTNPDLLGGPDIPAGATVSYTGAALGFNNLATNQDGCKGATVNLSFTAS